MDPVNDIATLLLGFPLTVLGIAVLRQTLNARRKGRASRTWPTTAGRVTTAEINISHVKLRDDMGEYEETRITPRVRYRYKVGEVEYSGHLLRCGGPASRDDVERYPAGITVTVYYNPANPAQAVLEPGLPELAHGKIVISIALTLAGGIMTLSSLRLLFAR